MSNFINLTYKNLVKNNKCKTERKKINNNILNIKSDDTNSNVLPNINNKHDKKKYIYIIPTNLYSSFLKHNNSENLFKINNKFILGYEIDTNNNNNVNKNYSFNSKNKKLTRENVIIINKSKSLNNINNLIVKNSINDINSINNINNYNNGINKTNDLIYDKINNKLLKNLLKNTNSILFKKLKNLNKNNYLINQINKNKEKIKNNIHKKQLICNIEKNNIDKINIKKFSFTNNYLNNKIFGQTEFTNFPDLKRNIILYNLSKKQMSKKTDNNNNLLINKYYINSNFLDNYNNNKNDFLNWLNSDDLIIKRNSNKFTNNSINFSRNKVNNNNIFKKNSKSNVLNNNKNNFISNSVNSSFNDFIMKRKYFI